MKGSDHTSDAPKISVVLVSFNTRQLTLDCLASLLSKLKSTDEVFVVDNASTDGSVEAIRSCFPSVRVIANEYNVGFGSANNLAFDVCTGAFILLLNTDTIVKAGAIQAMADVLCRDTTVGAVGCRLENKDGSLQRSCWSFPTPQLAWYEAFGLHWLGVARDWHRWNHNKEQDVDFVIGAALMVRREVLNEIGGFDEDFFLYAEEADWQLRMHKEGWKVRFTPFGTIIHFGGASGATMKRRQIVEFCRSNAKLVKKHHGSIGLMSFRVARIIGLLLRIPPLAILAFLRGAPAKDRVLERLWHLLWWVGLGPRNGFFEIRQSTTS